MDGGADGADLGLAEVLSEASEGVAGVIRRDDDGGSVWTIDGEAIATVAGGRAEFRLDPLVARAALRTSETSPSARGRDWVVFAPGLLDDAAVDRAEAWFHSAVRRSTRRGRPANR